ncbi:hypothetical protein KQR54_18270 [Mycobacterium gordonae]|nr:hypothetical protein [Mycobacterium gordonae]
MKGFHLIVEGFIKRNVDIPLALSLTDSAFDRFVSKMVILISKETHPRAVYKLGKDDVRSIFLDVFSVISKPAMLDASRTAYSYETSFNQYRVVFSKTKKGARDILRELPFISLDSLGRVGSLQKVTGFYETYIITESGEERSLDPWLHTINIYGNVVGAYE